MKSTTNTCKVLAVGFCAAHLIVSSASANLTFDLRASGGSLGEVSNQGKSFTATSSSGNVTLELWAMITNSTAAASTLGFQSSLGSIISTSTPGTATGPVSAGSFPSIFNVASQPGLQQALSTTADGITDLGSASTTATGDYFKPRKDPTATGIAVGSFFYAGASTPGVTSNVITNGIEIYLGTATLSLANFTAGSVTMNYVKPAFGTVANKNQVVQWTEAGLSKVANTNAAELFFNPGVVITVGVPEPTSFAMLMIGSLGLVGFRRPSFRRSA